MLKIRKISIRDRSKSPNSKEKDLDQGSRCLTLKRSNMIQKHSLRPMSNTILRPLKGHTRFEKITDLRNRNLGLFRQGHLISDLMIQLVLLSGIQHHHTVRKDSSHGARTHMLAQLLPSCSLDKTLMLNLHKVTDNSKDLVKGDSHSEKWIKKDSNHIQDINQISHPEEASNVSHKISVSHIQRVRVLELLIERAGMISRNLP